MTPTDEGFEVVEGYCRVIHPYGLTVDVDASQDAMQWPVNRVPVLVVKDTPTAREALGLEPETGEEE